MRCLYRAFSLIALALTPTVLSVAHAATSDTDQMRKILSEGCKGDVEGMTAPFLKTDKLIMFEWNTPRYRNYEQYSKPMPTEG